MDNNKDFIARRVERVISHAIHNEKQLNRLLILVDTEREKDEILSCIDSRLKEAFPEHKINVFRTDLATIQSMSELSYAVFHNIYESQDENIKQAKDFSQWIEDVKNAEGVIGSLGMALVVSINQRDENGNNGYGLFVFDNLDKANDGVLNGVKGMYHDGDHCIIPLGWEFISFCCHDVNFFDPSFNISTIVVDYNKKRTYY